MCKQSVHRFVPCRRRSGQRSLPAVLRLGYGVSNLSLEEAHLTPSKMVHDQHPCLLADFLSEQQIANYPAAFKASAHSVPPTIEVAWINSRGLRVDLRLKVLEG